jgi:hypothetical protein
MNIKEVRPWGKRTVIGRFLSKVTKKENGCWIWGGSIDRMGYGRFSVQRRDFKAHRFAFEYWRKPIPEGLCLDHLCRQPLCVNPEHLDPVTQRINLLRGNTFQARNLAKTHCPKGHPYDSQNTFVKQDGSRMCRECGRIRVRARRAAAKLKPSGSTSI